MFCFHIMSQPEGTKQHNWRQRDKHEARIYSTYCIYSSLTLQTEQRKRARGCWNTFLCVCRFLQTHTSVTNKIEGGCERTEIPNVLICVRICVRACVCAAFMLSVIRGSVLHQYQVRYSVMSVTTSVGDLHKAPFQSCSVKMSERGRQREQGEEQRQKTQTQTV